MISLFLAVALFAIASLGHSEEISMMVDLGKTDASNKWIFLKREVCIRNGELVLDSMKQKHVYAFLKKPMLSDFTVWFKVYVEPKGKGVRAFGVRFHSPDSSSAQFVHVYPDRAVLAWANEDKDFHELARNNNVRCRLGIWHDFKLECRGMNVKAFLDGKLMFDEKDERWNAGRIGFHSSQGLVRIKDIRLEGRPASLTKPWRLVAEPPCGTFHELPRDDRHADISGKLDIKASKPFIISSKHTNPERGRHIFPVFARLRASTDDIFLIFNKEGDFLGARRNILRSSDKGKTWQPVRSPVNSPMVIGTLRDGTVLCYDFYGFMKEPGVFYKEMGRSLDRGKTFEGPLLAKVESPSAATNVAYPEKCVARYRQTSARRSKFDGGNFSRTLIELADGSLLADGCALFKDAPSEGHYKHIRIVLYKSTDKSMTWRYYATVAYDPKIGFHEPVIARCSDGSLLCMMRVGGHRPLMQARSRDDGKTWDRPRENASLGVFPDLCLMSNGILACSYGRPGNRIMFSADGTGETWSDRLKIYEYTSGSTGYTAITEVELGKLLFVYDRRGVFAELNGRETAAIQGVYITVRKK